MATSTARIVLVGGHESASGRDLARFVALRGDAVAVRPGFGLHDVVISELQSVSRVVVVPMTFGRDTTMVVDTATSLRWLTGKYEGRIALAQPFGQIDHLIARLRAAAVRIRARDARSAMVVTAPASNPFDDAELHRVAHLVRVFGSGIEVTVATEPDGSAADAIERSSLLGFDRQVLVPAGFADGPIGPVPDGVTHFGPLMSDRAVVGIVSDRAEAARHQLDHGQDGIDVALHAGHGHGFAHSHDHDHDHSHDHGTRTGHGHSDTGTERFEPQTLTREPAAAVGVS